MAARRAATELLSGVLDDGTPLDAGLEAPNSQMAGLSAQDRSLARAIVSIALRRHGQIEAALGTLIERRLPRRSGLLQRILEVAAAQILFMEVPDHAAVSVALALADGDPKGRHFKPLANGVLRSLVRARDTLLLEQDEARLNTPDWLWDRWNAAYGSETARLIAEAHLVEPPLDLTAKREPAAWAERLGGRLLPTGTIRIAAKGRIETMAGYDEGDWWVQDAAAALPARLLGDVGGKTVLDLCAAPGGKTAQLANAGAKVTAVDISATRMARLRSNLTRLQLEAECVVADALVFSHEPTFDAVLVDAPCSATGTIRRHPDIQWLKDEAGIVGLAIQQRRLLERAVALCRPGGTVAFVTCSLEPEEGEALMQTAAGDLPIEPMPIETGDIDGLQGDWIRNGRLRTLPHHQPVSEEVGGVDGFFAARFRRQ